MKTTFIFLLVLTFVQIALGQSMVVNRNDGSNTSFKLSDIKNITFETTNIPTNGLIAYYPFNGNANDESGNGNNGTVKGGVIPTTDRKGNANKAMQFNGTDGYILVPNSSSIQSPSTALTITGWIWIDGYNLISVAGIVNKSNSSSYGQYGLSYHDWDSPTKLVFYLNQGDGALAQSATLSLSKWYFIAAVYGNNNISIYLDGNKIGSKALPIQINKDNNPITIGLDTPGDTEYLKGKLDDIRIYNIALSDQDVKAIFYE